MYRRGKNLLLVVLTIGCSDSIDRNSTSLATVKTNPATSDATASAENESVAAFAQHLLPALQSCAPCHGQQQAPLFAVSDAAAAHRAIMDGPKVDFQNIPNSRLVRRLTEDEHNCVDDCQVEGAKLSAAITAWQSTLSDTATAESVTSSLDPAGSRRLHYDIGRLADSSYNNADVTLQMNIEPLKDGGGYAIKDLQINTHTLPIYIAGIKPLIDGAWDSLNSSLTGVACAAHPPYSTLVGFEHTTIFVADMGADHKLSFSLATIRPARGSDAPCDTHDVPSPAASIDPVKKLAFEQSLGRDFRRYCSCHPQYATSIVQAWKNRTVMADRINGIGRIMPPTTHAAQMTAAIKEKMLNWLRD